MKRGRNGKEETKEGAKTENREAKKIIRYIYA